MIIETSDQGAGWVATLDNYDGPGSPIGLGQTEEQAVADLLEQLNP